MRRHHQRLAGGERFFKTVDEIHLGLGVHRPGRLVEEQDFRRGHQRARQHQQRALPARQAAAAFPDRKIEAGGIARQEDVGARARHRVDQLLVGGARGAEHEIVAHRTRKQVGVLRDIAEALADLVRVILAAVEAVDRHLAVGRGVKPAHQPAKGRLTRGDAADDPDPLAGADLEVDPRQAVERGLRIAEAGVDQFEMAGADFGNNAAPGRVALVGRVHHPLERIERRHRLLAAGDEEGELPDRRHCAPSEHDDRDDRAHRDLAFVEQIEAADDQRDADQLLARRSNVDRDRGQPAQALLRRRGHRGVTPPFAEHLTLGAGGLEGFDATDRFDQHRVLEA